MENNLLKPNTGIGLGIAGLVLGIVALPLAFFGCTSVSALVLAILGVAFSTVALTQAKKVSAPTSLIMAALVVSIIAVSFAALKFTNSLVKIHNFPWEVVNSKLKKLDNKPEEFGRLFKEEFEKELGGNLEDVLKELENELDDMDEQLDDMTDELEDSFEKLSDEEAARRLGKAAGRALRGFVDELGDSTEIHIEINTD